MIHVQLLGSIVFTERSLGEHALFGKIYFDIELGKSSKYYRSMLFALIQFAVTLDKTNVCYKIV